MTKNAIRNCFGIHIIVPFLKDEKKITKYLNYLISFFLRSICNTYEQNINDNNCY